MQQESQWEQEIHAQVERSQRWAKGIFAGSLGAVLVSGVVALLGFWLGGCSSDLGHAILHNYPTQEQVVTVPKGPMEAYLCAYKSVGLMEGGIVTAHSTVPPSLTAEVSYAVRLNVIIEPVAKGSQVTIRGSVMPHKMVMGEFDEVQKYAALLQKCRTEDL